MRAGFHLPAPFRFVVHDKLIGVISQLLLSNRCQLWDDSSLTQGHQPYCEENAMSRMLNAAIPVTLLLSALALSACASKPEAVPVAEPAPVAAVAEKPSAPEVTPEPAPAPVAIVEQPAVSAEPVPKPAIHKSKKIAVKHAPPKAPPSPPVIVPAPIAEQQAVPILPPEPSPAVTIAPPVKKIAEAGFLERYWLWLLGLGIVIAATFAWLWRSQGSKH